MLLGSYNNFVLSVSPVPVAKPTSRKVSEVCELSLFSSVIVMVPVFFRKKGFTYGPRQCDAIICELINVGTGKERLIPTWGFWYSHWWNIKMARDVRIICCISYFDVLVCRIRGCHSSYCILITVVIDLELILGSWDGSATEIDRTWEDFACQIRCCYVVMRSCESC